MCGYIREGEELPPYFVCPICKHGASGFRPAAQPGSLSSFILLPYTMSGRIRQQFFNLFASFFASS
ncbi:MAG: rubredoxin-like domain-containing protein [Christensenellales bacterium]